MGPVEMSYEDHAPCCPIDGYIMTMTNFGKEWVCPSCGWSMNVDNGGDDIMATTHVFE